MKIKDFLYSFLHRNEKNREITFNVIGGFCIKGLAMILSMFSLPLHISFFNNNVVLGVWFTALSVLTWVNMFDFGLTNGLRNSLVSAVETKDKSRIKQLFFSTAASLGFIAVFGIIIFIPISFLLNLNVIFNVEVEIINPELLRTIAIILFSGTMISFVLKTITALNYALQKSTINSVCSLVSTVIPLLFMVFFTKSALSQFQKIISLSIIQVVATWIPLVLSYFIQLRANDTLRGMRFEVKDIKFSIAKEQLKIGGGFFVAQGAFLFITQTNEFLISSFFDPSTVVNFRAYNSLFLIVGSVFQVALAPVWSSVTKAYVQKDYKWLYKLTKILYLISGLVFIAEFIVVPFVPMIFKIWLKDNAVEFSSMTAMIFALYGGLYMLNILLTTLANGLGKIRLQVIFYSIGAILKIPEILLIMQFNKHCWQSVIIANIVALAIFCIAQMLWLHSFFNKQNEGEEKNEHI